MISMNRLSLCVALALSVSAPFSASAVSVSDANFRNLEVRHSGMCFDLAGGKTNNAATFHQWRCSESNSNQRLAFTEVDSGFYTMQTQTSGKCVEVANGQKADGATIQQMPCASYSEQQQWSLLDMQNGWFKLKNRDTGKCLDVAGAYIKEGAKFHQWECLADHPNQEFRFINDNGSSEPSTPDDGNNSSSDLIKIEAESFSQQGGSFEDGQANPVSVYSTAGQQAINYINSGDYVDYHVAVAKAGMYEVSFNIATAVAANSIIELLVKENGQWISYAQAVVPASGWDNFSELTASSRVKLPAGTQNIRLHALGSNAWQWNLESFSLSWQSELDDDSGTPIDPPVDGDADQDGVLDSADRCANTPAGEGVDANGCALSQLDSDQDGVSNAVDLCPDTPAGTIVDNTGCEKDISGVIDVNTADPSLPSFMSFNDTTPLGKRWQQVESLSDEFDYWNSGKWVKTNWNYGSTPVNMLNKNSGVDDGNLWIRATLNADSPNQWFETSRVRSQAKIKFPMYTESRIKVANISAYSTFWLNNGDINNRDEIDIIEINPTPTRSDSGEHKDYPWQMNSQYFIAKNGVTERNKGNSDNRHDLSDGNTLKGVVWNEDYHVFGAWWKDAHTVQFYLNGEPVNLVKTQQAFSLEQFIIWDLWTQDSPWVGGLPAKDDLLNNENNIMKVDWIRTWKLVDE